MFILNLVASVHSSKEISPHDQYYHRTTAKQNVYSCKYYTLLIKYNRTGREKPQQTKSYIMLFTLGESINITRVTLQVTKRGTTTPYIHSWSEGPGARSAPSISQVNPHCGPYFIMTLGVCPNDVCSLPTQGLPLGLCLLSAESFCGLIK